MSEKTLYQIPGSWYHPRTWLSAIILWERGGAVVECRPCGFDSRPSHHLVSLYWSSSCERFVAASWNPRLISVWDRDSNSALSKVLYHGYANPKLTNSDAIRAHPVFIAQWASSLTTMTSTQCLRDIMLTSQRHYVSLTMMSSSLSLIFTSRWRYVDVTAILLHNLACWRWGSFC
jgi:hypothetical protein